MAGATVAAVAIARAAVPTWNLVDMAENLVATAVVIETPLRIMRLTLLFFLDIA
ncbi:hypothetical protein MSZK_32450 [Mycobacterium sp. shizuoka-1]|nr:hypothetical protein MSZK_32450 [Mycobacterium sp. shizuoka-1]